MRSYTFYLTTFLKYFVVFVFLGSVIGINTYFLLHQSIGLDEAQSIWIVTKPMGAMLQLTAQDVHPPLYNLLLHYWLLIFGTDISVARILSVIFFVFTIPFLFQMSKESSNSRVAFLTVILFSLSPFILWYSSEARMYSMLAFATAANSLYFLRMFRTRGDKGGLGFFITAAFGLYTHYFFILLLGTQALFVLYKGLVNLVSGKISVSEFLNNPDEKNKIFVKKFFKILISASILLLPWLLYVFLNGSASNTQPLIPKPTTYNIFELFVNVMFGFPTAAIQTIIVSMWPLLGIIFFFVFTHRKTQPLFTVRYFLMATFIPVFIIYLGSFIKPVFLSRYLIFITPTFFFLIAWILVNYAKKLSSYLIAAVIVLMLVFSFEQDFTSYTPVKENYKGVAEYLYKNASANDVIAVTAPFTIYPLEYSYNGITTLDTIPQWDRLQEGGIPPFNSSDLITQVDNYKKQYARLFVVYSYNQGYENKIKNYLDEHYKIEKTVNFSQGLWLRVYTLQYGVASLKVTQY